VGGYVKCPAGREERKRKKEGFDKRGKPCLDHVSNVEYEFRK
jgi:hypothetical protein